MINRKTAAILQIRSKVLDAARYWFKQHGFVEVHSPILVPAVGEWPGYFEVKYFDRKAYLSQGLQPYATAFVRSFSRVYTIAPSFRAEKALSKRHLTEYWRIEVGQQSDFDSLVKVQENLISHICSSIAREAQEELKCLSRSIANLKGVRPPFLRVTYDEVINMLQDDGFNVSWGQRIGWEMERHISRKIDQPFFIWRFPSGSETLFFESDPSQPELTLSADLIAPAGYGEIGSGAKMLTDTKQLLERMLVQGIASSGRNWYLDVVKDSPFLYSGFVTGLERLVQWICKLKHIKEACAFPRLPDSIYP